MVGYWGIPKVHLGLVGFLHPPDEIAVIMDFLLGQLLLTRVLQLHHVSNQGGGKMFVCFMLRQENTAPIDGNPALAMRYSATTVFVMQESSLLHDSPASNVCEGWIRTGEMWTGHSYMAQSTSRRCPLTTRGRSGPGMPILLPQRH